MATYNCADSSDSAYGAGSFGTCTGSTQPVGAPDTGVFQSFLGGGSFTIVAPLIAAVVIVVIATVILGRRKKSVK